MRKESAFVMAISPRSLAILLGRRSKETTRTGRWDFFGGRLKKGEKPVDGARREFIEETGIYPVNLGPHIILKLKKRIIHVFPFYQLTENSLTIQLNNEHDKYRWVTEPEMLDNEVELTPTASIILHASAQALKDFTDMFEKMNWDLETKIVVNVKVK